MRALKDLVEEWIGRAESGALFTTKHDPNQRHASGFHTKISTEVSASFASFLRGGAFDVEEYRTKHPNECWAIVPTSGSFSDPLATAFTGTTALSGNYDRLLIASGSEQGSHVSGEESTALTGAGYTFVRKVT